MLDDNSFYDLIIKSPTMDFRKLNFPEVGYIDVKGDTLRKLLITDDENPIGFDSIKR
ncbi:MAG: hypothetical protein IPO37_12015 [Saprospiraceae bacterium]|nr:hypothetical protein [Saprospiraceae bacterium]